jgi:hypothetical protein
VGGVSRGPCLKSASAFTVTSFGCALSGANIFTDTRLTPHSTAYAITPWQPGTCFTLRSLLVGASRGHV